jgi:hypothetical protein
MNLDTLDVAYYLSLVTPYFLAACGLIVALRVRSVSAIVAASGLLLYAAANVVATVISFELQASQAGTPGVDLAALMDQYSGLSWFTHEVGFFSLAIGLAALVRCLWHVVPKRAGPDVTGSARALDGTRHER